VSYSTGSVQLTSLPGVGENRSPTLNLSSNAFGSIILGGITMPIFDAGLRSALLKQSQDHADASRASLRNTLTEAVRQIVAARNALRTVLAVHEPASRLVEASQTDFNAAWTAYRSGAGSVSEAQRAANSLSDARIARSDAYHAVLIAGAGGAFSTGALSRSSDLDGEGEAR